MDYFLSHTFFTGVIFALGAMTVWLSIYSCVKFDRFKHGLSSHASKLSQAISWQLAGEAIIGLGTLMFATAEFMGWLRGWPWQFTSFLRFIMFTATALTTLHLVRIIEKHNKKG